MNSGPPEVQEGLYRDPPGENTRPVLALEPKDFVHIKHYNPFKADYRIETIGPQNLPDCLIKFVRLSDGAHYFADQHGIVHLKNRPIGDLDFEVAIKKRMMKGIFSRLLITQTKETGQTNTFYMDLSISSSEKFWREKGYSSIYPQRYRLMTPLTEECLHIGCLNQEKNELTQNSVIVQNNIHQTQETYTENNIPLPDPTNCREDQEQCHFCCHRDFLFKILITITAGIVLYKLWKGDFFYRNI
jgi:hypothetical protein